MEYPLRLSSDRAGERTRALRTVRRRALLRPPRASALTDLGRAGTESSDIQASGLHRTTLRTAVHRPIVQRIARTFITLQHMYIVCDRSAVTMKQMFSCDDFDATYVAAD